ncbi:MAG: hypothetical protein HY348_10930 [Nitrospira defluvii]|nr:hypothetical protein [Nitrospira defluvii]
MLKDKVAVVTLAIFLGGFAVLYLSGVTSIGHLIDNLMAGYFLAWGLYVFLSEESRAEVRNRFLLTTAMLAMTLLSFEFWGATGLVDYRKVFRSYYPASTLQSPGYEYDPELLWVREPHTRMAGVFDRGNIAGFFCLPPQKSRTFDVRYDRNGFRNSTDLMSADIALVGDSYVEAPILEEPHTFAAYLSRLQGGTVANLGMSGYGPQQELFVLERFALPLHPKTVVWVFFEGNDLQDLQTYTETSASLGPQPPVLVRLWFRSLTRNLLATLVNYQRRCVSGQAVEDHRGLFIDRRGSEIPLYFMPGEVLSAKDAPKIEQAVKILARASQVTLQQGIRHVVVFAPTKYRVHKDLPNVKSPKVFDHWVTDDFPEQLEMLLARAAPHVEFLDLTPAFRDEAAQGILTFFEDDTHWNAEGHRIAAQALHRLLSSERSAAR